MGEPSDGGLMQAIHLPKAFVASHRELEVSSIPIPKTSSQCPVLIRVTHCALNYVDILYAKGKHQNNRTLVRPPLTLGLEFAGVVVQAPPSSDPDALCKGQSVFGGVSGGAFAEYVACPADAVRRVPDGWTLREAAGIAATAPVSYGALARMAQVQPDETVLVHAGAGGLGVMACQIARALGAHVIATVGSEEKARVLRDVLGVADVVNYSEAQWEQRVLDLTGGKARGGVDVVFDSVGLVEQSIRCTKFNGRILVIGFAGREGNLEQVAVNRVLLKQIHLIGYRHGETGRRMPSETAAVWAGLDQLFRDKAIVPLVYHEAYRGLGSIPRAMDSMLQRQVYGKAVIDVDAAQHGGSHL